jgi:outer membrane protein
MYYLKNKLFLLLLLAPFLAQAQGSRKLKLDEAMKLGLEQSRSLKLSQSKMALMDAKFVELKDMALPSVQLSASYYRLSDVPAFTFQMSPHSEPITLFPVILNNYSTRASVSEPVFTGFRLKNGILSQQYLLEASKLDFEKDKSDITNNIVNAYYNLYKVQISKKLIQESLKDADERLKVVKNLEQQGLAIHNDVLRVELQRSNIELSEVDANNNLEVANYNFGVLTGLPDGTIVEIDSVDLFRAKDFKSFPDYLKTSLDKRSDLKAADMRRKAAETNMKVARGNFFPNLSVGANYYYSDPNPRYVPPVDAFHSTWDVGLSLNWNLTSLYTTHHQESEAKTVILQNTIAGDQITDAIRMEVNQDFVNYEQSLKKIDIAQRSVSQAEENYRTMLSKYNNSTALLSELLDADVLKLQAKLNLTFAKADAEIAFSHLLKSTGTN